MATAPDSAAVIASALTEIGINGRLTVTMHGERSVTAVGELTGADYEVTVTVVPLVRDGR